MRRSTDRYQRLQARHDDRRASNVRASTIMCPMPVCEKVQRRKRNCRRNSRVVPYAGSTRRQKRTPFCT